MGKNRGTKDYFYIKVLKLLKLEFTKGYGRINFGGTCLLLLFSLLYTSKDFILSIIGGILDAYKTTMLGKDIYHEIENISVFVAVLPTVIVFIICLFFLHLQEKSKE